MLVSADVVATAETSSRTGSSCTDPTATVNLATATLAEGEEVAAQGEGEGAALRASAVEEEWPDTVVATTGPQLAAGAVVLDNLRITSLGVSISSRGLTIHGKVAVTLSGETSTLSFAGTLHSLEAWSVTLSSEAIRIPGLTVEPVSFAGVLSSVRGAISLTLDAEAPSLRSGDIAIENAALHLAASSGQGATLSARGRIAVGPSKVDGIANFEFDRAGTLVKGNASVLVELAGELPGPFPAGTPPADKLAELSGTATLVGNAHATTVTFVASGHVGPTVINQAAGMLDLGPGTAAFSGKLDVAQGSTIVRFDGAVNFAANGTGTSATSPPFTIQGAGLVSGTLPDGTVVSLDGQVDVSGSNGSTHFAVNGAIQIGNLRANGSATVDVTGTAPNTVATVELSAGLETGQFAGSLSGSFVVQNGRASSVDLTANLTGAVELGDVTVTGAALAIQSSGGPLTFTVGGAFDIGDSASLAGSATGVVSPEGQLLSLSGSANGDLDLGDWAVVEFAGTLNATPAAVTVSGSARVEGTNFPAGVAIAGSFTMADSGSWAFSGSGALDLGPIRVGSARLTFSHDAGMMVDRVGTYITVLFIPVYFEFDIKLRPDGGCEEIELVGGGFFARVALYAVLSTLQDCTVTL